MTFNEYAVECSLYEYSNDRFNLMKECSEIALGEQWVKSQLILRENAEDLGISGDISITESYLMESADQESLEAMYEKTEEKKAGVFSKFIAWIKKCLAVVGKWFMKLAGQNYDIEINELKAAYAKNERFEYELGEARKKLEKAGVHIKVSHNEINKLKKTVAEKDEKIKSQDKRIGKMVHGAIEDAEQIRSQKRTIADLEKSGKEKDAEINRQQDTNMKLGQELSAKFDIIQKQNEDMFLLAKENNELNVIVSKLPSACNPFVMCDVMVEFGALLKKGYESNGMMIKPNAVRVITKKLDDAIAEQRSGKMTFNMATKEFANCGNEMQKLLEGLQAQHEAAKSTFDAEAGKLIDEAMVKISKTQADTMNMIKPLIAARGTIWGLGKMNGKNEARKEQKKKGA